jgi:hypothetical protein
MGRFDENFAFGARGVALAIERLERVRGVTVTDAQDDAAWQRLGVDLLWARRDLTVALEVKYEREDTGNVALESISNTRSGAPGWWLTSHAHVMLLGLDSCGGWWVLHLPTLRREIRDSSWTDLRSIRSTTHGSHQTSCRLLPIERAVRIGGAKALTGALPEPFLADAPRMSRRDWTAHRAPTRACQLRACACR